jgi:uncharacterized protein (TIGR03435 family)
MKILVVLMLALIPAVHCVGQAQSTFEVAVVRPSKGNPEDGFWSPPGVGKFTAHNVPLTRLLILAYGVNDEQIANKPSWLESDLFNLEAKPAAGIALNREELKPMLQALLQERFHLAIHTEDRATPGYALTVARGGPKLQPTKGTTFPGFRVHVNREQLNGLNWSMPFFAATLQQVSGRPVVDQTGLTGSYDIKVQFSPDLSSDSPFPSLFTALDETLGLKLKPQKVAIKFLVIDHVDRTPTEN